MTNHEHQTNFPSEVQEASTDISEQENILTLAERMDFLDVQLLRKFYSTGKSFPNDTQPFCFPVLYIEMKVSHKMQIGLEALRKRLDNLVKLGLLEKVSHSNPANYMPVRGKENSIRELIKWFFAINRIAANFFPTL